MDKKVDFEDYAERYNEIMRSRLGKLERDESYFSEYKVKVAVGVVTRMPLSILDYGCGVGRSLPYLRQYFPHASIAATDLSVKSLALAKAANLSVTFFDDSQKKSFEGAFDLIFVACVFHHVPPAERSKLLSSLKAMSSPKGQIIIFEHNPFNPVTRRIVNTCPFDRDAVLIPPQQMKKILSESGFAIQDAGYTMFFPSMLRMLRPLEKHLRRLPAGGQYYVLGSVS